MAQKLRIEISHNCVIFEGQKVVRPAALSPTQWLEFWEDAQLDYDKIYDQGYQLGFEDGVKGDSSHL